MSRTKTSQNKDHNEVKVVRVTKTEFELSDGRIYQHPFEFAESPTLQEFRLHYKLAKSLVDNLMKEQDQIHAKPIPKASKAGKRNEHKPSND